MIAGPAACGIPESPRICEDIRNSLRHHPQVIISFERGFELSLVFFSLFCQTIFRKRLSEALSCYGKNPQTPDFCLRFSLLGIEASFPASEDAARQTPPAAFSD
ncbi:MAG: hypothetical protein A3I05_00275 [Deltaproteobacteria bacterium RIFCSPLOWO2_02_FULL_44_10]|nr:MAG: hypothetical protein A3C46_01140 [Deltaproteobacteria bacterium RIFCSPHIGHO2_02_FULL_44_16]OGQ47242.1 MAG: hypothetical protein A3I05_00275 [Deltaproteobacteria bacterium RIFCSPLOWO2_02_FULL_44_10]